jgi:hypothetical protein
VNAGPTSHARVSRMEMWPAAARRCTSMVELGLAPWVV